MTTWRCNRLNLPYLEKHRACTSFLSRNLEKLASNERPRNITMVIKGILCKVRDTFCCLPLKLISRLHVTGYILTFLSTFTSAMNQNFVKFGEIFFFPKKRRGIFSIFTGFIWNALVPFKVFLCFEWNFHISNERIYMRRLIKKNHAFEFRTWTKTLISLRFTNLLEWIFYKNSMIPYENQR